MRLTDLIEQELGESSDDYEHGAHRQCRGDRFELNYEETGGHFRILYLLSFDPCTCGIGTAIVNAIRTRYMLMHLVPVAVDVMPDAEAFWEKVGFVPDPDNPDSWIHENYLEEAA